MQRVCMLGAIALLVVPTGGCELVTSFEARIVDAGPDAVPGSCFSVPGCVECDPVSPTSCPSGCDGGTCPGCDGGDCDPLPAERDPWPAVCNELVLAEDFSKTPKEGWGRSYNDLFIKVESCGLLQWSCPPHHTIWAWLSDELAKDLSADLVETRIFPRWRGSWTYTLGVDVVSDDANMGWPETQGRSCALGHDEDHGLKLSNRVTSSNGSRHESVSGFKVGGGSLVLQSWKEDHKHHCRLLAGSGKPVVIESEIEGTMPKQGTIKLALVNEDVTAPYIWFWIDYLRVYRQ